jgi:glutamyl-tRNA synthetase
VELGRPYLVEAIEYEQEAVDKHLGAPGLASHIEALVGALGAIDPFDEAQVEAAVRGTASERGLKAGALIHAVRVAATGRTTSPGLFEVLVLLGRERTVKRLTQLVVFLGARA